MHNKKCNNNILNNTLNINIMEINKDEIIMMLVKQNAELIKQQSEFKNMIIEQQKIMIHNIENK
jgi:hypothetical protein